MSPTQSPNSFQLCSCSIVDPLAYERHHKKEAVDTAVDPRALLVAEASEKMRQRKSLFTKGLWNVAVVELGGLGADVNDLAAVRLEGADESLAIERCGGIRGMWDSSSL